MTWYMHSREAIERIAMLYNFAIPENVEKLMMDFYVLELLSKRVRCVLRGGLCMPFYVGRTEASRLSVDVDILTSETKERIKSVVPEIMVDAGLKCKPDRPMERIGVVTRFTVKYETKFGKDNKKDRIKLDIMHDVNVNVPHCTIPRGFKTYAGETTHDIVASTRGALLADKISSLSFGSIGYSVRKKDIAAPKQMYDVGVLLDGSSPKDIDDAITTFPTITQFKVDHASTDASIDEVLEHTDRFLSEQLSFADGIRMGDEQRDMFNKFKSQYLSRNFIYDEDAQKLSILKTWLYASCLKAVAESHISRQDAIGLLNDTMVACRQDSHGAESAEIKRQVLGEVQGLTPTKSLQAEPLQNLRLLAAISGLRPL